MIQTIVDPQERTVLRFVSLFSEYVYGIQSPGVCCKIVDCSNIVHRPSVVASVHCSPRVISNHPMIIAEGTYSRGERVSAASVRVSARWEGVVR